MGMVVTAGQRGDSPQFGPVLAQGDVWRDRAGPGGVHARRPTGSSVNKAYASAANRRLLRRRGILP